MPWLWEMFSILTTCRCSPVIDLKSLRSHDEWWSSGPHKGALRKQALPLLLTPETLRLCEKRFLSPFLKMEPCIAEKTPKVSHCSLRVGNAEYESQCCQAWSEAPTSERCSGRILPQLKSGGQECELKLVGLRLKRVQPAGRGFPHSRSRMLIP